MSDSRVSPGAIAAPAALEGIDAENQGNHAGNHGIELNEYSTSQPQAQGQVLELMGFRSIARHRSREVLLYRQGDMNVVINAHHPAKPVGEEVEVPAINAVAFRFRDAAQAYRRALDRGAWPVSTHIEVMELNIPAIHGVGATRIYFVDRYREFSIYSVDFVPIPGVDQSPPPIAGLHWFGLVQYVGIGRLDDWTEFYHELFGFMPLPDEQRFGILPKGRILKSPCGKVHLQLVAPEARVQALFGAEHLERIGLGTASVPAAVRTLRERGVEFYVSDHVHVEEKGALTSPRLGGVMFELVRDPGAGTPG